MSNLDCSAALQPCNCSSSQVCIQIGRSSTECAKNTCVDKASSGGGGGGSSVGAVAGQAVGGVIGGLVIIVVVYFYWRRKRRAGAGISFNKGYPTGTASQPGNRTGAFGLFNRRNDNSSNGLRNFKMGPGGKASPPIVEEKQGHAKVYTPSPLRNVTSPPGPGEEDAQSIKRQSLRFDPSNNGTRTSRRSLSGAGLRGVTNNDNPFADHHSEDSRVPRKDTIENSDEEGEGGGARNSNATLLSDFSYRSSQSTNIIPIAYIPAHASQSSTIDMVNQHPSRDSRRPHSVSTNHNGGERSILDRRMSSGPLSATSRASRASVPLSLRSNSTGNVHDSLHGATFSTLFDDRNRSSTLPPSRGGLGSTRAGNGRDLTSPSSGLEIIAPGMGATSPPALTTPTMTKDGRPIRPPRAPGLDLKLPTPEASLSPPTSPGAGFPWNRAGTSPISPNAPSTGGSSLPVSPNTANAGPNGGAKSFASMQARLLNGAAAASGTSSGRETLLSPTFASNNARASAYSTFSQSTDNSGSHMSYILEAPQIVTPVSAGGVQVQTLSRAAAKTVVLPHSNSGNSLSAGTPSSPGTLGSVSPANQYASSPLARGQSSSPLSDNPFDDDAAVRIAIPSSQAGSPSLPLTPTFGTAALHNTTGQSPQQQAGVRASVATTANTRRDSDLSIFTSSEAHHDGENAGRLAKRTARNSFASSFASVHNEGSTSSQSGAQSGRAPSPSSFAGTTGHSIQYSNKSTAPSVKSVLSSQSADEVILSPPNRPFVDNGETNGNDSRHNSTALSMRSGYGSVLDGIPFNLSLSPEARHSQASEAGTMAGMGNAGSHVSVPFTFGTGPPLQGGRSSTATTTAGGQGGVRDSSVTYRTSIASSSAHTSNDKRDTAYSLASEWNGAFAGMPILMGGIAEEAVPEVPSMYRQSTSSQTGNGGNDEQKKGDGGATNVRELSDDRYSSDSSAMAAAVARQFDERND